MEINTYENIYSLNLHKSQTQNGKSATATPEETNSSTDLTNSFGTDSVELSDKAREILFKSNETENKKSEQASQSTSQPEESATKQQKEIARLEDRDREVRIHEQTHKSVGGPYAGPIIYEFKTGPDGQRYAVGGHVNFNVGEEATPEASIQKADVIYKAAMAPVDPSAADHNVAKAAMKLKSKAQAQLQEETRQELEAIQEKSSKQSNKILEEIDAKTTTTITSGSTQIVTEKAQMSATLNII